MQSPPMQVKVQLPLSHSWWQPPPSHDMLQVAPSLQICVQPPIAHVAMQTTGSSPVPESPSQTCQLGQVSSQLITHGV